MRLRRTSRRTRRARSPISRQLLGAKNGKWNKSVLAAYGRKTLGVVQLAELAQQARSTSAAR